MSNVKLIIWRNIFLFLLILQLSIMTILPARCLAVYVAPQTASLAMLKKNSGIPVSFKISQGYPRSVMLDVPASGINSLEQAKNYLSDYAPLYLLDNTDVALHHIRTEGDPLGHVIVRLGQTFRGIPVYGAEIVVHLLHDATGVPPRIKYTSGALMNPYYRIGNPPIMVSIDTVPAITAEKAEAAARLETNCRNAPVAGSTMLMIYDPVIVGKSGEKRLVYRVSLGSCAKSQFLIDAITAKPLFETAFTDGDGYWLDQADIDIEDANGGNAIDTTCYNPTTMDDTIGDESGMYSEYMNDYEAWYAWYSAREVYRVFHDKLYRHSFDDANSEFEVYVHAVLPPDREPNAWAVLGCGIEFSEGWVGLDGAAHEFTHLVTYATSNLTYAYQSGALSESFSDIMAAIVDPNDWLHAEDRTGGGGPLRSLSDPLNDLCGPPSNPVICGLPDKMSLYVHTNDDHGGVHTNCGIINKAFYLMAAGGTFNGWTIKPIGRDKMGWFAYNVFIHLPSNANFYDIRHDAVSLATLSSYGGNWGLGGFDSEDLCTVRNAFRAVEIGCGDSDCDGVEEMCHDTDEDGVFDAYDNCPENPNPDQVDIEGDGIGDACDDDSDNDGFPNDSDPCWNIPNNFGDPDHDGVANCLDADDDNDGLLDGVDNCPENSNTDQFDCDKNGIGDACDLVMEYDDDGLCGDDDNCPFVFNPDQGDKDADGIGDACDRCPDVSDNAQAYLPGNPAMGIPPRPLQPDSDGDGIPDACDGRAFVNASLFLDEALYSIINKAKPDGKRRAVRVKGTQNGGDMIRVPVDACQADELDPLGPKEWLELVFVNLPDTISAWVEDDNGLVAGNVRQNQKNQYQRGVFIKPRCMNQYMLCLRTDSGFEGESGFDLVIRSVEIPEDNPYTSPGIFTETPPPFPDSDNDGLLDSIDNCPETYDPTNRDSDGDGIGDVCDTAPPCEEGDLDGDCNIDCDDYLIFKTASGSCLGDANYLADADADNNGCVDEADGEALLGDLFTECVPTFAEEITFDAKSGNGKVILNWTAVSEVDVLGYNILRKDGFGGTFIQINNNLIAGRGSIETTVNYEFIDDNVQNGKLYQYKLIEVQSDGNTKEHGPVKAMPRIIYTILGR